jgi:signal transduction histidine kinase
MTEENKNTLLIVDDESFNLKSLTHILMSDYTIYTAENGIKAIEKANTLSPDLILLDILMPEMDGYQTFSELQKNEKTKNIPVIIITGLNSIEDEEKGLDLGAVDFIPKPFSDKIVKSRVRNQMQIINQIRATKKYAAAVDTANRSKSAFLAKMSHEIRTPLNAILGLSEIYLRNESLQQKIKDAFIKIYNSGDLLLSIINDLLDISKIEAGKLELSPVQYDVAALINDVVFLNMVKYEKKAIEFKINVDENVPAELFGDDIRIKQILNNLLSNAFKYTKEGEVELSVALEDQPEKTGDIVTVIFRVSDTGQGMTAEQVNSLFEEYYRFNLQTNRATEGTGLGMNIVYNLVDAMNGEILTESELGKGSLFTLCLPQGNVGAPLLSKETINDLRQLRTIYEAKMKKNQIVRTPISSGKVLVVDDVDINLYIAEEMLSFYELQIDTAANGVEAIEKIKQNDYDLVFMDHIMPSMDGMETTRRIRELGAKYEKLPVVALTANTVSGVKEMFLANGFNGFISKPLGMHELDEVLKEWLPLDKCSLSQ